MRPLLLIVVTLLVAACGEDDARGDSDADVVIPPACESTLVDGDPCDDGSPCTVADACLDGLCIGEARAREPFVCNAQDDDCDGVTDEDCATQLRLTGAIVGAGAATFDGVQQALGTRTVIGASSNDSYRMEARQ